jgi:hypothetical protein
MQQSFTAAAVAARRLQETHGARRIGGPRLNRSGTAELAHFRRTDSGDGVNQDGIDSLAWLQPFRSVAALVHWAIMAALVGISATIFPADASASQRIVVPLSNNHPAILETMHRAAVNDSISCSRHSQLQGPN